MDVAPRVGDDLDPKMIEFLHDKVNSFVKWDLIRFFHDNPHAADTAENIARYTGRDILAISDELAELVVAVRDGRQVGVGQHDLLGQE